MSLSYQLTITLLLAFIIIYSHNSNIFTKGQEDSVGAPQAGSVTPAECLDFDIFGLLPINQIFSVVSSAIRTDPQTQDLSSFIQGQEFNNLVQSVRTVPGTDAILAFLRGIGLNLGNTLDGLESTLGSSQGSDGENTVGAAPVGVGGVIKHISGLIPADRILQCYNLRMNVDPIFKTISDGLSSPEFVNLLGHVRQSEQYSTLQSQLSDRGLEVNSLIDQALNFLRIPPG